MSDFFGDDFTAELRNYFLTSVIEGATSFTDLIDGKTWKRIRDESSEQAKAWAVDAKTNEFTHLAKWLEEFDDRTRAFVTPGELIKCLNALKEYATDLQSSSEDSLDLARKYFAVAENTHEVVFLHCRSGSSEFAVPLLSVIEISAHLPLFPLPEKHMGILGVVPHRGDALPVVNLQDYGFKAIQNENVFYLVCEQSQNRFCLQVTGTEDIISLKETDLQTVEENSIFPADVVKKFFIHQQRSLMILDLEKLVA